MATAIEIYQKANINMTDNSSISLDIGLNQKTKDWLNIFWIGIIIYFAGFTLSTTTAVNYVVCQLFQILGIILFIPMAIKLIQWRFDNNYLKILFIIYYCWLFFVIFRGFSLEYENLKIKLLDVDAGIFPFLVPLILLFPKNLHYYKEIFKVIFILSILFIIYNIIFRKIIIDLNYTNNDKKFTFDHFAKMLSIPSGFILLTFLYHNNKQKFLATFVIITCVAFAIFRARRTLLFMSITPLLISYLYYISMGKNKFIIIIFSFILGLSISIYGVKFYNDNKNGVFKLLTERIYEDTRTNVEQCLYEDMNTLDWIIGKGINGKYYCPGIDLNENTGYRSMIETDYLNIILKGGLISLGLLLFILIPGIIKGVFYSKNLLSKAAAVWILLWVIELYPANVYSFSLNHILVWISIGICYSKPIRNLPESTLMKILSNNKLLKDRKVIFQS